MAHQVHRRVEDGLAVLTLDRPPVNALTPAMRDDFLLQLDAVCSDPAVNAVVIAGSGSGFSAGLDLTEFDALQAPTICDLCISVEEAPKPVVAAVQGAAIGAGFELALAAHARVARRDARVSLPEVTLGLMPGGGATQRLPRLAGAQAAMEIMLSGRNVAAGDKRLGRVFDRIVEKDPLTVASDLAGQLAQSGKWVRTRDRVRGLSDPKAFQRSVAEAGTRIQRPGSAGADIVAAIEAAQLLPFEQGLAFEQSRYRDRLELPETRGIRHSFGAERRAAVLPKQLAQHARTVQSVAVVGNGAFGAELALLALSRGLATRLWTGSGGASDGVIERVRLGLDGAVGAGQMPQAERDRRLGLVTTVGNASDLAAVDLVLDTGAVPFDAPVPLPPDTVWAVAGDVPDAGARAREVGAGDRLLRLRMSRPAQATHLIEAQAATDSGAPPALAATVHRALSAGGRPVVLTARGDVFAIDALFGALCGATLVMLAGGVPAAKIATAARALGFADDPLRMIDRVGAMATLARSRRVWTERQVSLRPLRLLSDRIADAGTEPSRALAFHIRLGESVEPDPGLADWMSEWREDHPDRSPDWPDVAPETALHAVLVNEALHLIDTKVLQRRSDADLIAVKAMGFKADRGGPLLQADLQGPLGLLRAMRTLQSLNASLWSAHPMLSDMVKNGQRLFGPRALSPA